jgi:O-antigen ligase
MEATSSLTKLKTVFNKIKESAFVTKANEFIYSIYFLIFNAVLALLGNAFGLELLTYGITIFIGVFVLAFSKDLLPLVQAFCFCYLTPSIKNNPGRNVNSVFTIGNGAEYLIAMIAVFAVALVLRLIFDKEIGFKNMFKVKRKLLIGLLVLGLAYLLAGVFSKNYFSRDSFFSNILFGALNFVSIFIPYFIFASAVKWKDVKKEYFLWLMFFLSILLFFELIVVYVQNGVLSQGFIDKTKIYTGWGICNNMGALMAMTMPASFYLAYRYNKYGFIFNIVGNIIFAGIFFTVSRASMLFGAVVYAICIVVLLIKTKGKNRLYNAIVLIGVAVVVGVILLVFFDKVYALALTLLKSKDSGRFNIYKAGFKQFLGAPIFGQTFFPVEYSLYSWSNTTITSFLPPRWHNTVIQLLASCGIFGLLAYGFHRFQTVKLFVKNPSLEKYFIGLCILGRLLTSLLDCHFFNLGPGLIYSIALIFVEKVDGKDTNALEEKLKENEETVTSHDTVDAQN